MDNGLNNYRCAVLGLLKAADRALDNAFNAFRRGDYDTAKKQFEIHRICHNAWYKADAAYTAYAEALLTVSRRESEAASARFAEFLKNDKLLPLPDGTIPF